MSDPTGLKVGDKAPSFNAVDQFGKQISLKEELKKGKVILTFYRGAWCRYCMKQFQDYQDSLSFIESKGATLIAITPEHEDGVAKTASVSKATFSILHDEQLKIMLSYDVISKEKVEEYRTGLEKTGVDNQEKFLPVPATYIINKKGKIEFVYFDPNYRVRVPIDQLLDHL
jgi:peroxiredoxin